KMPSEGSYAIWNNRGGSGKTNLTYHLAIKYAYRNPDKTVLVVDMCPQADLSHAFLGKFKTTTKTDRKKKMSLRHVLI
ncbi:unnamed protein product, partial [Rotaria magnacalcarata]